MMKSIEFIALAIIVTAASFYGLIAFAETVRLPV